MDETEVSQMEPNLASAMAAISLASDMLSAARTHFGNGDYPGALADARDGVRMASSALMFRDGFVAATFEAASDYLSQHYSQRIPLENWERLEHMTLGESGFFTQALFKALGRSPAAGKQQAEQALGLAEDYVEAVKGILGVE